MNVTCAGIPPLSALIYKSARSAGVVSEPTVNFSAFISVSLCIYVLFFKIISCAVIVPAIWFFPFPFCSIVPAELIEQPGLRRRMSLFEKTAVSAVSSFAVWVRVIFSAVTEILFAFSLFVNLTSDADGMDMSLILFVVTVSELK